MPDLIKRLIKETPAQECTQTHSNATVYILPSIASESYEEMDDTAAADYAAAGIENQYQKLSWEDLGWFSVVEKIV